MARGHDLAGLTVLAMLAVRAGHPYELHRFIVDTHKDYVTGLPRSLYHAVERLAKEELIVPVETTREGRRPRAHGQRDHRGGSCRALQPAAQAAWSSPTRTGEPSWPLCR
ncbi:PadR family transcriptional regulator [Nonomuraea dietziae]|uniref:Transcription regulator PadR N-terminal domain-containing protein n=1 Tax=Nonomuraea dietziae TaxID=65515 RepID=A0A7W5YCP9_9ACTN|nr:hypothetical protein [Nonomuraea dietziae]MBB3729548.1 hypothetical protein [Nonomuraea dietziae]